MKKRLFFLAVFILIYPLLLISFPIPLKLIIPFAINFLLLFLITLFFLLNNKKFSPGIAAYIVFCYLFFNVAPIIQIYDVIINNKTTIVTSFKYSEWLIIKSNILIFIFHLVFFISHETFCRIKTKQYQFKYINQTPLYCFIFFFLSILIFFFTYDFVISKTVEASHGAELNYSKLVLLINSKFLLFIPFSALILGINYLKKRASTKTLNYFFVLGFVCFFFLVQLIFKNPLNERRNAIGAMYLTLLFIIKPNWLNNNLKIMIMLFFIMIIMFPVVQIFTHINHPLDEVWANPNLILDNFNSKNFITTFNTLNYDAFINLTTTIDYVDKNGTTLGMQLLGTLLFFVPRSFWHSKPLSTGEKMAGYLSDEYGNWWFTNLSNPLVSEGYINFGILGVILFAIVLAFVISRFVSWLSCDDPLRNAVAFFFCMNLIFLLRGSLMSGYAYFLAAFLSIYLLPKFILKSLKNMR